MHDINCIQQWIGTWKGRKQDFDHMVSYRLRNLRCFLLYVHLMRMPLICTVSKTFFSFEIPSKSTSLNQISSPFSLFVCLFLREFYRLFAIEKTTKTHDKQIAASFLNYSCSHGLFGTNSSNGMIIFRSRFFFFRIIHCDQVLTLGHYVLLRLFMQYCKAFELEFRLNFESTIQA